VPPTLVPAVDGGENALGIGGPDERLGLGIVLSDVAVDRRLEVHNRAEHPAPQPPLRERCKVCLVVFGRDEAGRPRASWFDAQSADLAIKAAELMQMRVLRVETEEKALARGRVSATGQAFMPFARANLYSKLVELAGGATGLTAVQASAEDTAEAHRSADVSVNGIQSLAAMLDEPNGAAPDQPKASEPAAPPLAPTAPISPRPHACA
jgi:hypothetical protein